jgi:hypothetical protein
MIAAQSSAAAQSTALASSSSRSSHLTLVRVVTPEEQQALAENQQVLAENPSDRRAHRRMVVSELAWLNHVRLKYGPQVSLIDLSSRGAQIETSSFPLQPGSTVVIEIAVGERSCAVPAQVLRCHIAGLAPHAKYRGALLFKRPFDFPDPSIVEDAGDVDCNPFHEYARLNLALRRVSGAGDLVAATSAGSGLTPIGARALDAAFSMIESARGRESAAQFAGEMGRLLRVIARSVENAGASDAIVTEMIERLRRSVPSTTVRVVEAGADGKIRDDAVFFQLPSEGVGSPARLVVEFPADCGLEEWHLQLLQGAAHVIGVTRNFAPNRETPTPAIEEPQIADVQEPAPVESRGWNRLVVRYLDGRMLKGYGRDFQPTRGMVDLWSDPDGPVDSRMTIPLAQLKAVFFVHDFEGDSAYVGQPATTEGSGIGRRITITFVDGEVLRGTTLSYSQNGPGFFVSPLDSKTNNLKMFVLAGAIRHVQFR